MRSLCRYLLPVLFLPLPSMAYDAEKHNQPSLDAFKLYQTCQQLMPDKLKTEFGDEEANYTAEANKDLDNITFSRLWNWHFYDARFDYEKMQPGSILPNLIGMNRSLHPYFVKQANKLLEQKETASHQSLELIGHLMHLIQDMAVPAHVAPIYHLSTQKDAFDGYSPKDAVALTISESECSSMLQHIQTPVEILEQTAQNTLAAIDGDINELLSWRDYWMVYPHYKGDVKQGFSSYGKCGNEGFGNTNDPICNGTQTDFDNFYNERYKQAVMGSLKLLIYTDSLISR